MLGMCLAWSAYGLLVFAVFRGLDIHSAMGKSFALLIRISSIDILATNSSSHPAVRRPK